MDSILNKTNKRQDSNMLIRPDLNQPGQKHWYWRASGVFQPGSRVDLPTSDVIKVLFCWACKTGLFLLIYRPPASAPKVTCCSSPHTQLLQYHCSIIGQHLPLLCWQNIQMDISVNVVAVFLFYVHILYFHPQAHFSSKSAGAMAFPPLSKVD